MDKKEIKRRKKEIDKLSQEQLARIHRFAAAGHPYFQPEFYQHFRSRFMELGGMTPELSKKIGW